MTDFAKFKKNLHTRYKNNITEVDIRKSALFNGDIGILKNSKEKERVQIQPLAAAILGVNNTSVPLPENTKYFRPNSYFDALELFVNTKPTCFLILGKPGGGAYSLGESVAKEYKCIHLSPKNILNDELEQASPTGRCIDFNMKNNKAITFETFFKMLEIKLNSDIVKHRGYVISGFPLVTCNRSSQYFINSLNGEEAVMVVDEILFDTIANLKKKKKKQHVSTGSTDTSLGSDAEIPGEGIEEEVEEEQVPEEENLEEEDEVKVVLPKFLVDTCSDIIFPTNTSCNAKKVVLLQQLSDLFNLKPKPDIIIYLTGSDKDMVLKKTHKYIDYKTHNESFEPFSIKTAPENRWPVKYTTSDYTDPIDNHIFNSKYCVRQPNNFEEKVIEQICNYRQDMLPFLEEKLKEFDPKFLLRIDAQLSTNEKMHEVSQRLVILPIKPVIIPQPLYIEEPPEEMEEFWRAVEELNVVHSNTATFNRTASPWHNRCPVELKKRHCVTGNPKFAVAYMEYVFVPSTLPNLIAFYKNPCPYLKLKYLEPPCRIIVMGTKLSGKTMISESLSWLFNATIINYNDILREEEIKKYEIYAKTVLSEIIATIEDARFSEWQHEEMERYANLDMWCKSTVTSLKRYIPVLKEYLLRKKKNADAFGGDSAAIDSAFMNTFNKIRSTVSSLPFIDDLNECERSMAGDAVYMYAPQVLRTPREKPAVPILGDKDVNDAITEYIEKNDLQKEIIPTAEEIIKIIKDTIATIDMKHQEDTNNDEIYGKYVIDGFSSDPEYWNILAESNILPDYTVTLIENREVDPELISNYKRINNCVKNHQERYILAEDPLIKTRLKIEKPLVNAELNVKMILHEFIDNTSFEDIVVTETEDVEPTPEVEPWLSFGETIDKFKEGWDSVKIKLEEYEKCFIEIQLENKTDVEIVEEIMLKLRKCYYLIGELNEEEEPEGAEEGKVVLQNIFTDNSPQNYGETGVYCPIAFYKYGVLWEGKPECSVRFDGRLYRLCKEENIELFQNDINKYLSYDKPYKTLPPLRICVIGCIGSGKTTISRLIAKELGLMYIDFAEIVNDMLIPKHFKKVGRQYENSFTDTPIDDEAVVEFAMDENNENFLSDVLSNESEVRKMVFNYFERGSQIIPPLMQKLISKLWFEDPFVKTGFVLDGYPKLPSDIEDMTACYCIPNLIIEIESSSETAIERLASGMFKTWKVQLAEAKDRAKKKFLKEKQEWIDFIAKNVIVKVLFDEILDEIFVSSEPIKGLSAESVIIDANPSGSVINANVFNTYNEMVHEFPEPTDHSEWENAEEVRERIDARLEGIYETDEENIQALKDVLEEQKIKIETIDGKKSLTKVNRLVLSKLSILRNRNESAFEDTLIVTTDIAELLLSEGLALISNKFHRMCPVYIYENPDAIYNSYYVSNMKGEVYPIIHRSNMYFICGKLNVKKFRANPLKYVDCDNIRNFKEYPLRIGVIGTPKSGRSTLSAKLAKQHGLICLSRGVAVRNILERLYWTDLGSKIISALTTGECIKTDNIIKAVQTMTMDHRAITNGFVFDGFPESASEAMELDRNGIYPNIIIDVSADKTYVSENSQKEIYYDVLKRQPPYSRPFIENRYDKCNDRAYNIRDWIQGDYQNLYEINGNRSKWECLQQAKNIIKEFIPKVHYYLSKVKIGIVPVDAMCISNAEFERKISPYKHMCPICLQNNILNNSACPVIKKGTVQYKHKYYWICPEHTDIVMKHPDYYLKAEDLEIPQLPLIIKRVNMSLVYEKGICIVTYAEHLPAQILVAGDIKYACSYKGNCYMFCGVACRNKFMAKPHLYYEVTVFRDSSLQKPISLKSLPNIGYLEQTVGVLITEACISATVHRPKYPGLTFQLSALLHIALYLKTHNPKIKGDSLGAYIKASKVYDSRCKLLTQVGLFLRSMDNPFAAYPKCCGYIKSVTESSISSRSDYSSSREPTIVSSPSRVPVPDERYDYLVEFHKPASKVPAFLNVVDIAGLVRGAAEGQGLGNAFLSHIKACDAIFNLVRAFDDEDVIHVDGDVNPVRDLETIGEELRLKDEEQLMANYEKLDRVVSRGGDKKLKPEYDALTRIKTVLVEEKKHIRFGDWSAADIEILNKYLFLTSKPAIYLVNLSEKDYIRKKNKWLPKLKEWIDKNDPGAPLIPFSGVLENKLMEMDAEERKAYLKEHNITSALEKIIVQGYKALNLEYFFTAGPDEVKAWTIQKGTKAPQAAGRIHTDFEKGFIMAEVMHYKDFKEEGSEAACKSAGKYRQQGRNYVVEDGDIIFFKFNAGAGLKDAKKK